MRANPVLHPVIMQRRPVLFSSLLLLLVAMPALSAHSEEPIPKLNYEPVPDFFQLPAGEHFIEPAGVAVNSKGHVCVSC